MDISIKKKKTIRKITSLFSTGMTPLKHDQNFHNK